MSDTTQAPYRLHEGTTPLLISLPHVGTEIPQEVRDALLPEALGLHDTDWHLESLYDFAGELGASLIVPRYSRYVVDLNRPPEDAPLYAGANNTGLCPTRSFEGNAIYRPGMEPDAGEIARRRDRYWRPYHDALRTELDRLRGQYGHALLLDGHSIRSHLPWLFEGKLPDLNLGTASGGSCDPGLRDALAQAVARNGRYTHVVDGRFQGGYITRHYGQPAAQVHAVQLEMCWSCYMEEAPPYVVNECRAVYLRPVLRELAGTMLSWLAHHG